MCLQDYSGKNSRENGALGERPITGSPIGTDRVISILT